jgi:hypothetical protein
MAWCVVSRGGGGRPRGHVDVGRNRHGPGERPDDDDGTPADDHDKHPRAGDDHDD